LAVESLDICKNFPKQVLSLIQKTVSYYINVV